MEASIENRTWQYRFLRPQKDPRSFQGGFDASALILEDRTAPDFAARFSSMGLSSESMVCARFWLGESTVKNGLGLYGITEIAACPCKNYILRLSRDADGMTVVWCDNCNINVVAPYAGSDWSFAPYYITVESLVEWNRTCTKYGSYPPAQFLLVDTGWKHFPHEECPECHGRGLVLDVAHPPFGERYQHLNCACTQLSGELLLTFLTTGGGGYG